MPLGVISKLGHFFSTTLVEYISIWLQTLMGIYVSSLCIVSAVWLNTSQRSQVGVGMNISTRSEV